MGDGSVAVRTRSRLRQENGLLGLVSRKDSSRQASKRKLATQCSSPLSDRERKRETDEDDCASPDLLTVVHEAAEPRGAELARDLSCVQLHSRESDDTSPDQPTKLRRLILKENGCFHEPDCLAEGPLRQKMSHCLRHRVVVPNCEPSAESPCGVACQTQTVHIESQESRAGWNSALSCESKSNKRLGASGAGYHPKEAIKSTPRQNEGQAPAKEGEIQSRLPLSMKDQVAVAEIGRANGKVLERVCKSATEKATEGSWDPTDSSHLVAVKSALHLSAVPETILCRDSEQSKLVDFCKARVTEGRSGSMYICGCPGTGKSLTVEKIKSMCGTWSEECPEMFTINCTSLTDPRRLYARFLQALRPGRDTSGSNLSHDLVLKQLKRILCDSAESKTKSSRRKMVLLVVDEMDYLITRDQAVLYDLFSLASLPNSRLILLGIANAIDLTDRLLPKLRSMNFKVEVLTFPTYNEAQILAVLRQRLLALPYSVFQTAALELCARRVAAAAGDMRKALQVCRSAIDVLEAEARAAAATNAAYGSQCSQSGETDAVGSQQDDSGVKGPNSEPVSKGGAAQPPIRNSEKTVKGAEQVQETQQQEGTEQNSELAVVPTEIRIDAMARALSRVFRSPIVETIRSLPRHQQLVLCAAVRQLRLSQNSLGRKSSNSRTNRASKAAYSANLADLHSVYLDFCRSSSMPPLAAPEFSSVCQVLSDQAMLVLGSSREDRLRKVGLKVDGEDVIFGLQGVRYLKLSLLQ